MIEHPSTISNSKNLKKLDIQSTFNVKNLKKVGFSDWIELKKSNNPIKIQQKSVD
jgi:hypothetical protein